MWTILKGELATACNTVGCVTGVLVWREDGSQLLAIGIVLIGIAVAALMRATTIFVRPRATP